MPVVSDTRVHRLQDKVIPCTLNDFFDKLVDDDARFHIRHTWTRWEIQSWK